MARTLKWKLKDFLEQNGISAYAVGKNMTKGKTAENLAYRWAKASEPPERLYTSALVDVIQSLERLTGKPVSVCDLLEYTEDS